MDSINTYPQSLTHTRKQTNHASRTECYIWATIMRATWTLCSRFLFFLSFFSENPLGRSFVVLARRAKKDNREDKENEKKRGRVTRF